MFGSKLQLPSLILLSVAVAAAAAAAAAAAVVVVGGLAKCDQKYSFADSWPMIHDLFWIVSAGPLNQPGKHVVLIKPTFVNNVQP